MAVTVANLIAQANTMADDIFDTADWVVWFNDALEDLAEYIYLEDKADIGKVDGSFPLPANIRQIQRVSVDGTIYRPVGINDMVTPGYKVFNNNIYLQGIDADTISLYFYRKPAKMSAAQSNLNVDVPDEFIEAIKLYGCMNAMQKDDETTRFRLFEYRYDKKKAQIIRDAAKRRPAKIGAWGVIR
jgi:hypothetical protein